MNALPDISRLTHSVVFNNSLYPVGGILSPYFSWRRPTSVTHLDHDGLAFETHDVSTTGFLLIGLGLATSFNHRHRQFLEHLHSGEWVRSINLPDLPKLKRTLLRTGWIEAQETDGEISYRITPAGLAEMSKPMKIRELTPRSAAMRRAPTSRYSRAALIAISRSGPSDNDTAGSNLADLHHDTISQPRPKPRAQLGCRLIKAQPQPV